MPAYRRHGAVVWVAGCATGAAAAAVSARLAHAGPLDLLAETPLDARATLIIGIVLGALAFCTLAAVLFLGARNRARRAEARARANSQEFDRKMDFIRAVLGAEPQLLVHWDEAGEPAIVADTLASNLDIPRDTAALLTFSEWLESESAQRLEQELRTLRHDGSRFDLLLTTLNGDHVEADGRAAGGGTVLKLKDLEGRRRELKDLSERRRRTAHELETARALLDALPMPVWFRGVDGTIEWVNQSYARAVDAGDAAEVYRQQIELLNSRHRDAAVRSLDAGEKFHGRVESASSGETQYYDAIILPVGQACAGIAMKSRADSSDTGISGQIVRQSRILDQLATAVAVFSPEQRLTDFNTAFAELFDLDAEWLGSGPREGEILDRLRDQRTLPEHADYRGWKAAWLNIYADGKSRRDSWYLPDGRTIHVVAERDPDGGITCLYENKTETLALKSRYNALMRVQKETLDNLGEGVAVFASDGRLSLYNPAFAAIWDLDAAELEQGPHIDVVVSSCGGNDQTAEMWAELKTVVTSIDDERKQMDGQIGRGDGMFVAYAALPLPDGGTLLTFVDISDTRRMQNALIERNEALVAADRLKSAFISHVSYELRTPLTNIIGFSEFLQNPAIGPLTDKQREYLGDIRSSSDTLLAIIDDILDMATIDAGNLALKIVPSQAKEIIDAAVLGVRERLTRANVNLDVQIEKDATEFLADGRRMTQVLYNLLSNAIGFSDRGGEVRLTCRREGGLINISVEDHGCGISPEYQQVAFDRFESKPNGSRHRGAGLGLSIVKSLVELHGGTVELVSVPDQGTRVSVRFPAEGPPSQREAHVEPAAHDTPRTAAR